MSTTVTGVAVPSLEARIAARSGCAQTSSGSRCSGWAAWPARPAIARLHDLLRGAPTAVAVLVSVELCSLTVQRDDPSAANMVASGLFGDGAAAVVVVGAGSPARVGAGRGWSTPSATSTPTPSGRWAGTSAPPA